MTEPGGRPTWPSSAAAPPVSTSRFEPPARARASSLVSRKPLAESSSYWAQGGLAAALAPDDSPARHAEDTLNAGRGLCRTDAVEVLTAEAPAAVAELRRRGVRFDLDPDGELALGLEGGHSARRIVHAGGAETGRADHGAARRARGREHRRSRSSRAPRRSRCGATASAARGVVTDARRGGCAARRCWPPAAARRSGAARPIRGARSAPARCSRTPPARSSPTSSSASSTPRRCRCPATPHDGALLTEAVRGEGATLLDAAGRRFTDELAPRDQVTAAILDRMDADGTALRAARPARASTCRASRAFSPTCRDAGLDPEQRAGARRSRRPLPDRRRADRPRRANDAARAPRRRRVRLHRPPRSEPPRLELAQRVLRLRGARRRARPRASVRPAPPPELPAWRFSPPTVATREAMWRNAGPRRTAEGLERLLDDPYPLARLDGRIGARAGGIARRAPTIGPPHPRREPRRRPPDRRATVAASGASAGPRARIRASSDRMRVTHPIGWLNTRLTYRP